MSNKPYFLKVQRRSNAGWQPNLAKRRRWFSDDNQSPDPETPLDESTETGDKGEEIITLPKPALNERLKRARNKARQDTLAEFGINESDPKADDTSKVDELQRKLEALTQQLTDLETAKVNADAQQVKSHQLEIVRRALSQAGVRDTEDVLPMLDTEAMKDDAGNLDETKLKDAIDSLRKLKSYLFNVTPGSPSNHPIDAKKTGDGELTSKVKRVINF